MKYVDSKVVPVIGNIGGDDRKYVVEPQFFYDDPTCECSRNKKLINEGVEGQS